MNKKIVASLATIAVVSVAVVGGTIAYFSSTQTSHGNIIKSGSIKLTVDHTKQVYNGVNCETCNKVIKSGTDDVVISQLIGTGTSADPVPSWVTKNAELVSVQPSWNWAVVTDGTNTAPWIWAYANPASSSVDAAKNEGYIFRKTFDWFDANPLSGTVTFKLSADDTYNVTLNSVAVSDCQSYDMDKSETNWTSVHTCHFTNIVNNGSNVMEIKVVNSAANGGRGPAGLAYLLVLDGDCNNPESTLAQNCQLWSATDDLTGKKFFNFDDVKPGDLGINVISLHVSSNEAHVCMYAPNQVSDPDPAPLADYIKFYVWKDLNGDGVQLGTGEDQIGTTTYSLSQLNAYLGTVASNSTQYLGIKWCFGEFENNYASCNGTGASVNGYNDAQLNELQTDLGFYAVQTRNITNFTCPTTMPGIQQ